VEPWDLGVMPKPENPPLRFLSVHQMDGRADNDTPPDPARIDVRGTLACGRDVTIDPGPI